ncbi:MAG: hypothetical protein ABFS56_29235 [Pseudomonadota bacterium]
MALKRRVRPTHQGKGVEHGNTLRLLAASIWSPKLQLWISGGLVQS